MCDRRLSVLTSTGNLSRVDMEQRVVSELMHVIAIIPYG